MIRLPQAKTFEQSRFNGELVSLLDLKHLQYLDLSGNNFGGQIPGFLENLQWLTNLTKLKFLSLSGITLSKASDCLTTLALSGVRLSQDISDVLESLSGCLSGFWKSWTEFESESWKPFQLGTIALSSWNLGPRFPHWLRFQKDFLFLDISDAGIVDTIPDWVDVTLVLQDGGTKELGNSSFS
ncbi:hypothetical protein F3Y22_tig00111151pilonHSYRG00067 [Hibiscus syriacus]|uniref:Uncharacterized protein n=1 Tax=Hibiscus syriacus TaxID=106335 RepID=A0A6A2YYW5_HIBSY|nr:hypothetical protein F3Y22_tig00111151pilonHSYRG00067 [Hibiscus syriacus]